MRKIMSEFKNSKIMKWGVMSLAIILIMSLVSLTMIYNVIYKRNFDQNQSRLDNIIENYDNDLISYIQTSESILNYRNTINLSAKESISSRELVELKKYSEFLKFSSLNSYEIANYLVYFPKTDIVFDKERIYFSLDELYDGYSKINDWDFDKFEEELINKNYKFSYLVNMYVGSVKRNVLPIKIGGNHYNNCMIIIFLDFDYLFKTISSSIGSDNIIKVEKEGITYYDSSIQNVADKQKNNAHYSMLTASSSVIDCDFQIGFNNNDVKMIVNNLMVKYLAIMGGVTILCVMLTLIFQLKISNVYNAMSSAFDNQKAFLNNYNALVLIQKDSTASEISEALMYLNIAQKKNFKVCVIRESILDSKENWKNDMYDFVCSNKEDFKLIKCEEKNDDLIYIFFDVCDELALSNWLKDKINKFIETKNIRLIFGIGNVYESSNMIKKSYSEARKVVNYDENNSNYSICEFNQLPTSSDMVFLETGDKNKLYNLILNDKVSEANNFFVEFLDTSCRDTFIINPQLIKVFVSQATSILIKVVREEVWEKEIRQNLLIKISELYACDDIAKFVEHYQNLISEISISKSNKNNKEKVQINIIQDYISKNYNDIDMSLTKLSEQFNMAESYISAFIKKQLGCNFTQYLEMLRMRHAENLLETTDSSINEIINIVGYANRNTFYKAFMRVYGESPKSFKERFNSEKR